MAKEKRKLGLFGYRDVTLIMTQIGIEGESNPLYLNKKLVRPYFVGERKGGKVVCFTDFEQIAMQKEWVYRKIKEDNNFVDHLLEVSAKEYEKFENILNDKQPVSREVLGQLVADMASAWRWWSGWWWATEVLEEKKEHEDLIAKMLVYRKRTENFVPSGDLVIRTSIAKLYPQLGDFVNVVTLREVLDDQIPTPEILQKRLDHYLAVEDEVHIEPDIESAKDKWGVELVLPDPKEHQAEENVIRGQIAYKGRYTGRVSIVFTREEANQFKAGDVLVASSTLPDFMYAIQRSGAIVTDEGGLISHAAITSRELKIPCVIGTKVATQILKNGDTVEVDAEKGIVRKIS